MPRSEPKIRRARLGDLDALCALENFFPSDRLGRAHVRHLLKHGHADIWVCEENGELIGNAVVLYRRGALSARMYSLVVHAGHQRRGIALRLMQTAEAAARAHGGSAMRLEVRPDNISAIKLYQKAGYHATGTAKNFYEDGSAALKMRKALTDELAKSAVLSSNTLSLRERAG